MVTLYTALSLDGYVAGEKDDLSWLDAVAKGGKDGDYGYQAFYASVDQVVMGRGTWAVCRTFRPWPYGDKPCTVLTRQKGLVPVSTETFEPFDPLAWKRQAARGHVYLCGGGEATRLFLEAGLLDRMELATIPVLLGRGRPLFPAGFPRSQWRLRSCEAHATGVVQALWERG
ncbi:MAG: dihydrofolate reductase [Deltaproteobacteria bacterium]|nr:dihydrofolate reductase [Deltaproteobacteria bacterium]